MQRTGMIVGFVGVPGVGMVNDGSVEDAGSSDPPHPVHRMITAERIAQITIARIRKMLGSVCMMVCSPDDCGKAEQ